MTPVDNPGQAAFRASARACVMTEDTDTSRPGRSCNSAPGLADQKDTDRLMDIVTARAHRGKP